MKRLLIVPLALVAALAGAAVGRVQDQCGPFTDVSALFCPYVLEAYYTGITAGTSPTTFSPDVPITRGQASVFMTKALNQALARGSRRAALGQWWTTTPHWDLGLGVTAVGSLPFGMACDGTDVWVTVVGDGTVARVRASDGRLMETWTGATNPLAILSAMGKIFLTTNGGLAVLYMIDPSAPPGSITPVSEALGLGTYGLAFDGSRIWVASAQGTVFIVTPGPSTPWPVTKVTNGFTNPFGIAYDGTNVWVADTAGLFRLDESGAILQTVPLTAQPGAPAFDGSNLWVPIGGSPGPSSVVVVQATTGNILATLAMGDNDGIGNAAFDGQRVLVTAPVSGKVYLWRAADFAPLGSLSAGPFAFPLGAASDGVNFWVTLNGTGQLGRF